MLIECKKRAEGYKPVKGNEKKILKHLLKFNYYDRFSFNKNKTSIFASKSNTKGTADLKIENNRGCIYTGKFNPDGDFLNLQANDFFKFNDDGSISKFEGELPSTEYVAVELNFNDDSPWGNWILNAPNILVILKDKVNSNPYRRNLQLGPFYPVNEGDILIFEKEDKTLIEILPRTSADMIDVLQENGYYITKKH